MPFVNVPDGGGATMRHFDYNGYLFPIVRQQEEALIEITAKILNLDIRDDDVMVYSYPKTGTTWLCEMVGQLVRGKVEYGKSKVDAMIEGQLQKDLAALNSPRVLNTHVQFRFMPKQVLEKKTKIVFVARNPKDTAVSFYHHCRGIKAYGYDGKWENFLKCYMDGKVDYGSYESFLKEFEQAMKDHPEMPVHILYYEDLKENCAEELTKVVKFLGLKDREDIVDQVAGKCQFSQMKNLMDTQMPEEIRKKALMDDFTFFRKGETGDWKNWFTVAQNEMFDAYWKDRMEGSMFKFRYTLDK